MDTNKNGSAINANIIFSDDTTVRLNAVYGVRGACSRNFASFVPKNLAEARLNDYITKQSMVCDRNGLRMIVAGDVNSYTQPQLDHIGGSVNVRSCCLAAILFAFGLQDSFRMRHPDKVAFTHISKSGGSRFDQLWIRLAAGATLQVVKATIESKWLSPTDHAPVLADMSSCIPRIEGKSVSNAHP